MVKKYLSLLLTLLMCLSLAVPALADGETSGTCGEDLTWTLEDGVLTISGTGAMTDCSGVSTPWSRLKMGITGIVIEPGVTSIGHSAFNGLFYVESVSLPESLTALGQGAFGSCVSLREIAIPDGLTAIPSHAFEGCSSLETAAIPASVTSIGFNAFEGCTALKTVNYMGTDEQWSAIEIDPTNNDLMFAHDLGASGKNGEDISWTLSADGTLTVSGTGPLEPVSTEDGAAAYGWSAYGSDVRRIVIEPGIDSIGRGAFMLCNRAESAVIPEGVTHIGASAFYGIGLSSVTLPRTLEEIGDHAFMYCHSLRIVNYEGTDEQWDAIKIGNNNEYLHLAHDGYLSGTLATGAEWELTRDGVLTVHADGKLSRGEDHVWFSLRGAIREIVVEEGVMFLTEHTFMDLDYVESISLPSSLVRIEPDAIQELHALRDVYYEGSYGEWSLVTGSELFRTGLLALATLHFSDLTVKPEPEKPEPDKPEPDKPEKPDPYADADKPDKPEPEKPEKPIAGAKGDIDGDGEIDDFDAALILRASVGLIDALDPALADVNGDGDVDDFDAALILRYSVGLIESFTA